jgi:small nuclear ribonucleoprotein (snRNP)-like protein
MSDRFKEAMNSKLKEFENYMNDAYKNSNHFDSQYQIEELKNTIGEKDLVKFINKQILIRKNNEKLFSIEYDKLKNKYKPRSYDLWEDALNWITHYYKHGEYVFFKESNEILLGQIDKITKKDYKIFVGRKIGTINDVKCSQVICHASNIKKLFEVIKK